MNAIESALDQAQRHVREGEARLARQIALIEKLDRSGHEHLADTARELLETFCRCRSKSAAICRRAA